MNVFFTADLHLGHDNIRRHCCRAADKCLIEGGKSVGFLRAGKVQGVCEVEAGSVPFDGKDEAVRVLDVYLGQAEKVLMSAPVMADVP